MPHPLESLLRPKAIALVGASADPGSVGQVLLANLLAGGFEGPVFAVNPRQFESGRAIWTASVADLPEVPDLAIVATPAASVPVVLGERGSRVAVVISGGLTAENGLRKAMLEAARPFPLRLVGPNCLGILMPRAGVNAAFARNRAAPGGLALISQSGALVTAKASRTAQASSRRQGLRHCASRWSRSRPGARRWRRKRSAPTPAR